MTEAGSVSGGAEDRERDLLRRLKSGEELAFERLVRDQGGRLLAVARRHEAELFERDAGK